MESNQWLWQILLQILLIALNAIFACAEIAVISVNGNHLKKMVAEGNRKAVRLQKLTEIPASFLPFDFPLRYGIYLNGSHLIFSVFP